MLLKPCFGVIVLAMLATMARAAELPAEVFARYDDLRGMTLSPDGERVAYITNKDDNNQLYVLDLKTAKGSRIESPEQGKENFWDIVWVKPDRLMVHTGAGYIAVNADGSDYQVLTGTGNYYRTTMQANDYIMAYNLVHVFSQQDRDRGYVLVDQFNEQGWAKGLFYGLFAPNVLKLGSRTGSYSTVVANPGDISKWITDCAGVVRVAFRVRGDKMDVLCRASAKAPWQWLKGLGERPEDRRVWGFEPNNKYLIVSLPDANGIYGLQFYDPVQDKVVETVFQHPTADVSNVIYSPTHRPLGLQFNTETLHTVWFDADLGVLQQKWDKAIPNAINHVVSMTEDERKILLLSESDRNPGTYYLFDRDKNALTKLVDQNTRVPVDQMAPMLPFKIRSRDGLMLHGYLTVPAGKERKNLPLVMLTNKMLWSRTGWGYNPMVQFLANRGYAVLQVNTRGSSGYGRKFLEAGYRHVGDTMLNDVEDAVRWTIKAGIADPKRIAIIGSHFGGYTALMGLVHSPDLYRCGISRGGISDWAGMIKTTAELHPESVPFDADRIGDPKLDADKLRAISPLYQAAKIKVPVLLVHGKDSPDFPAVQSEKMADALKREGTPCELFTRINDTGPLFKEDNLIELYGKIAGFLQANMQ
jgi:dipeptidyl aminopeptidase/acylaminoacyl peptidase